MPSTAGRPPASPCSSGERPGRSAPSSSAPSSSSRESESLPSASEEQAFALEASRPALDDWAVKVEHLSVTYRTTIEKKPTLKKTLMRLGRRERIVRETRAVRNVSLDVPHGVVVGIVGVNGAGKSTLVRTVAGILPPTSGRVEIHGRVSTLLALGVGFNRDLSGRENVILGGLAAGLDREHLEEKYEEIVDFAELEDFMDMPM